MNCPTWEYKDVPGYEKTLVALVVDLVRDLQRGKIDRLESVIDSKPIHHRIFSALTPVGYEYYAGHYRGEDFPCLKYSRVGIPSDPRVGYPPEKVADSMRRLAEVIRAGMRAIEAGAQAPNAQISGGQKQYTLIVFVCRIFDLLLRVHPYLNGNGHIARFTVWGLLAKHGYWPAGWPIEPRPSEPSYTQAILAYRNGQPLQLEELVSKAIRR